MSEEAKKEATEHINLKVLGQDGQVVHFKIKQHTSLKKLMSAYCARSKLAQATVRFRFDGQPISENDTPRGLDMEDGDTIEVFQQQTGGYQITSSAKSSSSNQEQDPGTKGEEHHKNGQTVIGPQNTGLICPQQNPSTRCLMTNSPISSNESFFQSRIIAHHTNNFSTDNRSFYSDPNISYKWFSNSSAVTEEMLFCIPLNTLPLERLTLIS